MEAATQAYLNTLTPAQKARSDAYFEGGYWLQLLDLLYALAVAAVFLRLGLGRWLQGPVDDYGSGHDVLGQQGTSRLSPYLFDIAPWRAEPGV